MWVFVALVVGFLVIVALGRSERRRRLAAAATVTLVVDETGVQRTLADGRHEAVTWAELQKVEAVTLPRGVRGEPLRFILDGGGLRGCIVPRSAAERPDFMTALGRLHGLDLAGLDAALDGDRPGTTRVLWERPPAST